jgi:hypothetical protein
MMTIGEVHGQAQFKGWDLRGLFAYSTLDDTTALNLTFERPQDSPIAETMAGGYLQVGYNLLTRYHESIGLSPYYRFEKLNTQRTVPIGFFPDPAKNRNYHTLGIEFRPIYNIVIKSDYQRFVESQTFRPITAYAGRGASRRLSQRIVHS